MVSAPAETAGLNSALPDSQAGQTPQPHGMSFMSMTYSPPANKAVVWMRTELRGWPGSVFAQCSTSSQCSGIGDVRRTYLDTRDPVDRPERQAIGEGRVAVHVSAWG